MLYALFCVQIIDAAVRIVSFSVFFSVTRCFSQAFLPLSHPSSSTTLATSSLNSKPDPNGYRCVHCGRGSAVVGDDEYGVFILDDGNVAPFDNHGP